MPKEVISSPPKVEKPLVEGVEVNVLPNDSSQSTLSKTLGRLGQHVSTEDMGQSFDLNDFIEANYNKSYTD